MDPVIKSLFLQYLQSEIQKEENKELKEELIKFMENVKNDTVEKPILLSSEVIEKLYVDIINEKI